MKIRTKTSIIIIVSVICMILFSQITLNYYINKDIHKTEERESRGLIARINANLGDHVNIVNLTGYSWANWDDTYYFVQDLNPDYIANNFNESMMAGYYLNIFIYINNTGDDVFHVYYNLNNQSSEVFPSDTLDILVNDRSLQDHSTNVSISGIMDLPAGPCLISAWSILLSNSTGSSQGTLIIGQYLNDYMLTTISRACGTTVSLIRS